MSLLIAILAKLRTQQEKLLQHSQW